jgi:NADH/NAD ratio-sensing transcriptional regulator Rex
MQLYLENSTKQMEKTNLLIDEYIKTQKPVVIYGCGTLAQHLLANSNLMKCNIKAVFDGNCIYVGKNIAGYKILSKSEISNYFSCVLILMKYYINDSIEDNLIRSGYKGEIVKCPM